MRAAGPGGGSPASGELGEPGGAPGSTPVPQIVRGGRKPQLQHGMPQGTWSWAEQALGSPSQNPAVGVRSSWCPRCEMLQEG